MKEKQGHCKRREPAWFDSAARNGALEHVDVLERKRKRADVEARHRLLQLVQLLHHAEELAAERDVKEKVDVVTVLVCRMQPDDE